MVNTPQSIIQTDLMVGKALKVAPTAARTVLVLLQEMLTRDLPEGSNE